MTFLEAVKSGFFHYTETSGRSARAEYWWFHLLLWGGLIGLCLSMTGSGLVAIWYVSDPHVFSSIADAQTFSDLMYVTRVADLIDLEIGVMFVFFAVTIMPYLAVSIRRLHDRSITGWALLLWLTPLLVSMISNVDRFGELYPNVMFKMQCASVLGPIGLLILFCLKGARGANRYGADPLSGKS